MYILPYAKQIASGSLMYDTRHLKSVFCNNLGGGVGRAMGGGFRIEGTHVYLWPIHADVWQRPSQYCNYPPDEIF